MTISNSTTPKTKIIKTDNKVYTAFINRGEVPVNAFKLLGASNKRDDDTKIGYFGSGLKYSIAVLIRLGVDFKIYSGLKEVKVSTRTTDFLDKKVQVITINGEKTSMTSDAGIDWEPWFASRELYSNALDEGGSIETEPIKPEAGYTKIYVDPDRTKLGDVFQNWQKYFANKRYALFKNGEGRILEKLSGNQGFSVYRKGILVYQSRDPSLFDYDLNNIEINESRIVKHSWQASASAASLLAKADGSIIQAFVELGGKKDYDTYQEWDDSFWGWGSPHFNPDWLKIIADRELVPCRFAGHFLEEGRLPNHMLVLPDELIDKLRKYWGVSQIKLAGENKAYFVCEDQTGIDVIEQSIKRIEKIGFVYTGQPPLLVDFKDTNCHGTVDADRICIDSRMLGRFAQEEIDETVLEEIIHHRTGYTDLSRNMQGFLFHELMKLGDKNVALEKIIAKEKQRVLKS